MESISVSPNPVFIFWLPVCTYMFSFEIRERKRDARRGNAPPFQLRSACAGQSDPNLRAFTARYHGAAPGSSHTVLVLYEAIYRWPSGRVGLIRRCSRLCTMHRCEWKRERGFVHFSVRICRECLGEVEWNGSQQPNDIPFSWCGTRSRSSNIVKLRNGLRKRNPSLYRYAPTSKRSFYPSPITHSIELDWNALEEKRGVKKRDGRTRLQITLISRTIQWNLLPLLLPPFSL